MKSLQKPLKAVMVEDDELAVRYLTGLIEEYPGLQLLSIIRNSKDFALVLENKEFDVLFLDVRVGDDNMI